MIINIKKSNKLFKRFQVEMDNNKKYDFGLKNGRTYIDDRTIEERENYKKRHLANKIEKHLIENLIPSPALFSYYLLWGDSKDLNTNIKHLNNLWKKKHNS